MQPYLLIISLLAVLFCYRFRHAISYIFMPPKKRRFVKDNSKLLGHKYAGKFWDKYN